MATIKIKFRTSSVKTKEGVLFYQIIHARVTRQINTGYKIFPSEWDKHLACIILPDNNDIRRRFLAQLTSRIAEDMHRPVSYTHLNSSTKSNRNQMQIHNWIFMYEDCV